MRKVAKIIVTDIKWDAPESAGLPDSVTIHLSPGMEYLLEDIDGAADNLSDYLSDVYEYCHFGFAVTCE